MATGHGSFHWNELRTRDIAGAKSFFNATLGWTADGVPMPDGTYWVFTLDGKPVGGMFDISAAQFAEMPPHWFAFVAVDDVDARIAQARAHGAEILREPFDVPMAGRIALLKDKTGAAIGWMTPVDRS